MPLAVRWSRFIDDGVERVDAVYGVYEIRGSDRKIVYIGHGILRDRLLAHLRGDNECTQRLGKYYRIEKTGSREKAEQRERAEMKAYAKKHRGNLPRCNRRAEYP